MSAELAKTEGVDVGKLGQIAARYYRDFPSLEHPRFAEMRAALLEYRTAIAMASDAELAEKYGRGSMNLRSVCLGMSSSQRWS